MGLEAGMGGAGRGGASRWGGLGGTSARRSQLATGWRQASEVQQVS